MDHNTQWLRREITRYLAKRIGAEFLVVALGVMAWMTWRGQPQHLSVAFSLAVSQLFVIVRVATALATNPLSQSAVNDVIENPIRLSGCSPDLDALGAMGVELGLLGFHPVVTVVRTDSPDAANQNDAAPLDEPLYDLLQSRDGQTAAALGRDSGTVTLMSRLVDGRIVVTSDLLIPPHHELIVNVIGDADLAAMGRSHQHLLNGLERNGLHLRPTRPVILSDLLAIEHQAYRDLGPFVAPFLALDQTRRPLRLSLRLSSATVLGRTRRSQPTVSAAHSHNPVVSATTEEISKELQEVP